jgi:membrane protease subunit (stomatin/prohibitin family)
MHADSIREKGLLMNLNNIDLDEFMAAAEDSMFGMGNAGFCTECGMEADGVEPDAERYACDNCGKHAVYGVGTLAMYVA